MSEPKIYTQNLISVAMPIYNAGKYLRSAVLSIVQQTYPNWELLLIDDGSSDNSLQTISDISDARIRIFQDGQNKGLAARLNECIDLARGEYLARMDQDDVSYPDRLLRQISVLQSDPYLDLVATRTVTIDETNQVTGLFPYAISHQEICAQPWRGFHFAHPTWMGRTEWFAAHRYAVPGPYFCEDQELLLRSYKSSRFATLPEVLFAYRIRAKVNWQKLKKTRYAVFSQQLHQFGKSNAWLLVSLAVAALLLKLASDALKKSFSRCGCSKTTRVDSAILERWRDVLSGLNEV